MTYSQNNEESVILELAGKEPGQVLDIGAYDGKTYSNSYALIERGWKALLVEPSPSAFAKLLALHGDNPQVTLVNAALGAETRMTRFYECADEPYSTTLESKVGALRRDGKNPRPYWVAQVTPSTLVNQLGCGPSVLSIDCEGTSVDVLMACPIGSWAPRVIVVEHDQRVVELSGWGRQRGYRVMDLNAENIILARPQ